MFKSVPPASHVGLDSCSNVQREERPNRVFWDPCKFGRHVSACVCVFDRGQPRWVIVLLVSP